MRIEISPNVTEADKKEILSGLNSYNNQFIDTGAWGQFGVYARSESGAMLGGLIPPGMVYGSALPVCG